MTNQSDEILTNVYGKNPGDCSSRTVLPVRRNRLHSTKRRLTLKRKELYKKVNDGDVRVIIGSTGKLGTGWNVQKRAALPSTT